jgi:hypothetical protein
MTKSGHNEVRRNRNIGTSLQGRGRNNVMKILSMRRDERRWWENERDLDYL